MCKPLFCKSLVIFTKMIFSGGSRKRQQLDKADDQE